MGDDTIAEALRISVPTTTNTDVWKFFVEKGAQQKATSADLWKFFEEKGAQQKASLFKLATWLLGFAAVILGFAVKEGFEKGLEKLAHPFMVFILGLIGLGVIVHTFIIVWDHGRHINRTFARADAARKGESVPQKIWEEGDKAESEPLPSICRQLLWVIGSFG